MKLFGLLGRQGTIKKVQEQLTGKKARAAFLNQCGYPNQPQGLMQRLCTRLNDLLPVKTDTMSLSAFGRLLPGPQIMQQARQEPLFYPPADSPAALWPWLSGQAGLRLARAACLNEEFQRPFTRWLETMLKEGKNMASPGWQDKRLLAFRVINLLFSLRFLRQPGKLPADLSADCLLHLYLAGQILAQELESASQPSLQQVQPAAALVMLGLAYEFVDEAAAWLQNGSARLGPALLELSQSSQSIGLASLASGLQSACLVQWLAGGHNLPQLMSAIIKLAPMVRALAPPWADDSAQSEYGPLDFASPTANGEAANLAALLLTAPDLRGPRRISELIFWLMGDSAADALRQLAGGALPGAIDIAPAGMSGLCTRWRHRSLGVWLITGPRHEQAQVAWPLNHGLGLCLYRQGKALLMAPVRVDKGPLARFSVSRQAMNALVLDEKAPNAGVVELQGLEQSGPQFFMAASFNGYGQTMLRRRVFLDEPVINIVDQIQAQGQHLCQVYFHFPPQAMVTSSPRGGFIIELNEEKWWFKADPRAQTSLVQGQANPPLGWAVGAGNSMLPSPTIVVQAHTVGSTRLNSSLALLPSA